MRTIKCYASLIKGFLAEEYDFIIAFRFQSHPLERWFGQSRQISGGSFLVGLREARENIETLFHHVDLSRCSDEMFTLFEDSKEVASYITDYVAKKNKLIIIIIIIIIIKIIIIERTLWWLPQWIIERWEWSWQLWFFACWNFIKKRSDNPIKNLVNYVCTAFAILEFVDDLITKSSLPFS